jgi:hypothetical protein
MLQEEAPWTGLCRVLEEDPLLRKGAPASSTTNMSKTLREFTASQRIIVTEFHVPTSTVLFKRARKLHHRALDQK